MQGKDFEDLVNIFMKFPGIGPRQAKRFVYFLLSRDSQFKKNLISALGILDQKSRQCTRCQYFFVGQNRELGLCNRCADSSLDQTITMIVEKDMDADNIMKTATYSGLFFILGGLKPSLVDKLPPYVRINQLKRLLEKEGGDKKMTELVIALSANSDGDTTTSFLQEELKILSGKHNIKISTLGRGLSTGADLEYSDAETIDQAFKGRH